MKWQCVICSAERRTRLRPALCDCGALDSFLPAETAISKFERASEIKTTPRKRYPTGDKELDALLGGGFPAGALVLLWGRGGSGKSRCALRWATKMGNTLALSLEMEKDECIRSGLEAGAKLSNLLYTQDEECELPARGVRCLVLDSISECRDQEAMCARLKEWAQRTLGIVFMVCHATKAGQYKGPSTLQHWGNGEIQVRASKTKPGFARVRFNKSRFCPLGAAFVPVVGLHAV